MRGRYGSRNIQSSSDVQNLVDLPIIASSVVLYMILDHVHHAASMIFFAEFVSDSGRLCLFLKRSDAPAPGAVNSCCSEAPFPFASRLSRVTKEFRCFKLFSLVGLISSPMGVLNLLGQFSCLQSNWACGRGTTNSEQYIEDRDGMGFKHQYILVPSKRTHGISRALVALSRLKVT